MQSVKRMAKPFVKWAGGKGQLLSEIRNMYPNELGRFITKYAEPFVGGGAVLFDVLNQFGSLEVFICDKNIELMHTYTTIRDCAYELIDVLSEYENEYLFACTEKRKMMYYEKRHRFNTLKSTSDKTAELAALFIFLNRTCFNGLYRVNAKGCFNVPQGNYAKPCICDAINLRNVSEKLQKVSITCGDYKTASSFMDNKTFAYFDPPYRPLTATASFTAYDQDGFNDEAQTELAKFIDELSEKGVYVVVSNSDPKNINEFDNFFDEIYSRHLVLRIEASRAINSNGAKRGKVSELLITNKELISERMQTMKKGGFGGANTKTGLAFEGKTDLIAYLSEQPGYSTRGNEIYYKGEFVARTFKKSQFYKFLEEYGIDWKQIISKRLYPDDSIYVVINNTLFVIECKFQQVAGSVDEKLQTCDFKKKQYQKLLYRANIDVEYIYLLSDWFKNPRYKDVLDYIISVGCQFYFEYIPLTQLGLPVPEVK